MKTEKTFLIRVIILFFTLHAHAGFSQSLLPGNITVEHMNGLSYRAIFEIYFDEPIPKEYITVNWGDSNLTDTIYNPVVHGCATNFWSGFTYTKTHTYSAPGVYTISYFDDFLAANVSNISNSSEQSMLLTASINVSSEFNNNTPEMLNCPIWDWGCCDWMYNASFYDADGDSLSFEIAPILNTDYTFTSATIDPLTADFQWLPPAFGLYAIAINIKDWRTVDNQIINLSSINRYMLVNVSTVGVAENTTKMNTINVYPNPSSNELTIESNSQMTLITISDLSGRLLFTSKPMSEFTQVNTDILQSGIYILTSTSENGLIETQRFIKQ
jgi:hypothetical protein